MPERAPKAKEALSSKEKIGIGRALGDLAISLFAFDPNDWKELLKGWRKLFKKKK